MIKGSDNGGRQESLKEDLSPPEDKGNVVGRIFLLWGIGILLPWNAVLTCFDFFGDEMKGYNPAFIYPFAVNGFNAMTQVCIIVYGYKLSDKTKIQHGFVGLTVIILLLPILAHYLATPGAKFISCFAALLVFGAINGMVQAQVFGLGGIMPGQYMGAIMFGNGISGIAMNLLRMVFVIALPDSSLYLQAQIFFILAALILAVSAWAYNVLYQNEFFLYYKNLSMKANKPQQMDTQGDEEIN